MQVVPSFGSSSSPAGVNGNEFIICSTPIIDVPRESCIVLITASCGFQPGATVTSTTLRIRRGVGALTDAQVFSSGNITNALTSGTVYELAITAAEMLVGGANVVYTLTGQANGGSSNPNSFNNQIMALLFF